VLFAFTSANFIMFAYLVMYFLQRILNCQGELVCYQVCRSGRIASTPARILGSYWLALETPLDPESGLPVPLEQAPMTSTPTDQWNLFADYVLVTTQEVEFYKVAASKSPQKPVRTLVHSTAFHWYLVCRHKIWKPFNSIY
jgi:hypothetical protein